MEKQNLISTLRKHMSKAMAYHCINGYRRPSFNVIRELEKEGIPHNAWDDFPLYINNSTPTKKIME